MTRKDHIENRLPFFQFEDECLIYSDGSRGTGFRIRGYDISSSDSESINAFSQKLESILVGLPGGVRLQVFYKLNGDAAATVEAHELVSKACDREYEPVRVARVQSLKNKLEADCFFVPEIYVFVRSDPLEAGKRTFFKWWRTRDEHLTRWSTHQNRFFSLVSQLEAGLVSLGVKPEKINRQEWFELTFEYFNFERSMNIAIPEIRETEDPLSPSLNRQLALTEIEIARDYLRVGKLYFRLITQALLPEGRTHASMIEGLMKLPFHFWISQNILTLDQRKEIQKLELRRRIANSMASGSQNVSDLESEAQFTNLEDLLQELLAGSERLISADLNIVVWAESLIELEKKSEEVLRAFRTMGQAEGFVEGFALADAFFRAAPSVCEGFRHKRMKTSNCAHLMPLYSSWQGSQRPVVLLSNREGTPFAIDPFAPELPNWNGLVFGGSGAGKSFTISQLMLQFCAQSPRPKIVWIDNGASSEKLIEVLNGEFVDLHLESGLRLNMFDLEYGEATPSSARIKLILGCLELILKDEDKSGLPKREKSLLEEAIFDCYRKTPLPTLSTLRDLLKCHAVTEIRKFADVLFSWTGTSAFGRMLDGPTNIKLTKDLVSIEVKGLENHRELKDIFLLLLTSYIKAEAAKDLARPYLLIIDEAQRLFKGSQMGKEFAVDCFRVFRKYNAGIWCISQNYKDFLADSELADSLMPNTTFVFILRQRKIDWNEFKSAFAFNDTQVELAQGLEIVKSKYSEFLLMQDEQMAVVRLEPEPLSYWICTTDGNDKEKIANLREAEPERSLISILNELSKGVLN